MQQDTSFGLANVEISLRTNSANLRQEEHDRLLQRGRLCPYADLGTAELPCEPSEMDTGSSGWNQGEWMGHQSSILPEDGSQTQWPPSDDQEKTRQYASGELTDCERTWLSTLLSLDFITKGILASDHDISTSRFSDADLIAYRDYSNLIYPSEDETNDGAGIGDLEGDGARSLICNEEMEEIQEEAPKRRRSGEDGVPFFPVQSEWYTSFHQTEAQLAAQEAQDGDHFRFDLLRSSGGFGRFVRD
jgi:hypothetical protein